MNRTDIQVVGVKDALRQLNQIDKRARRSLTREYREIMAPTVAAGKTLIPDEPPLSGFARNWTPQGSSQPVLPPGAGSTARTPRKPTAREMNFPGGRAQMRDWLKWQAGLSPYVSGKRPKTVGNYTRNLSAFGIRWQSPAAVLFDTSGQARTPQGARMIAALNAKFRTPSRVMWRAWDQTEPDVLHKVTALVERVMRLTGRNIKAGN